MCVGIGLEAPKLYNGRILFFFEKIILTLEDCLQGLRWTYYSNNNCPSSCNE
uniref:Uncharacterized protein n=1 Tax=Physcomitrium patens TaxID=3218 RepID=A0A2K1J7X7_PHYPA|nr:hypothetical protein PHYPA_020735 [Physcomitrium patens]